jgi:hypothetical protein
MNKNRLFSISLICISFISLGLYAQDNSLQSQRPRHQWSIILDDIFAKSPLADLSDNYELDVYGYKSVLQNIPKAGLGYKLNFKNSAFRSKISFGHSQNTLDRVLNESQNDYAVLSTQINVGFEKQKSIGNLQLFYGVDVFLYYASIKTKSSYKISSAITKRRENSSITGYGPSPFVGVNYFIFPNLSVSTELNFTLESYTGKGESGYEGSLRPDYETNGIIARFGPVGNIGINLYF